TFTAGTVGARATFTFTSGSNIAITSASNQSVAVSTIDSFIAASITVCRSVDTRPRPAAAAISTASLPAATFDAVKASRTSNTDTDPAAAAGPPTDDDLGNPRATINLCRSTADASLAAASHSIVAATDEHRTELRLHKSPNPLAEPHLF